MEELSRCYRDHNSLPDSYRGLLSRGVEEALTELKDRGFTLAVASNGKLPHVERVLDGCG